MVQPSPRGVVITLEAIVSDSVKVMDEVSEDELSADESDAHTSDDEEGSDGEDM